jgi:mRNA-degrading endonuclease toxin of MazEF toxin-antitoxin module
MKMKKPRQYFRVHNNPKDLPERYPANASCHCVPLFGEAVSKLGRGLHLCVVAPLPDWKDRYASAPWMLRVDPDPQHGLDKVSSIDCFQVRSISENRFTRQLGKLPDLLLQQIVERILLILTD